MEANGRREMEEKHEDTPEEKMSELVQIQDELERAKDSAMQSWLDSRPLIDELEKLQSELASTKNRTSMFNIVISELESQLQATNSDIKFKMEEELKATNTTNEMTQDLDSTRQELEAIKQQTDEERKERKKLKQVLRMRKQKLRTLQLSIRAVRMESEAFEESAEEAKRHITSSEIDSNSVVQLTQEEYYALKGRAKDETALAEWRISVSMEQKLAAEANRNLALSRLKEVYNENRSKRRRAKEEKAVEDGNAMKEEKTMEDAGAQVSSRRTAFPKARAEAIAKSDWKNPQQKKRRSRSNSKKISVKKKKPSIFSLIRSFFCGGRHP